MPSASTWTRTISKRRSRGCAPPCVPAGTNISPMFERIRVIGRGRLGSALVDRLTARGYQPVEDDVQLVVLCVPDAAIAEVAATVDVGPWVCHMSGATPLSACAPHARRFGVHPLQTFRRDAGQGQFDGAWGAISGETPEAIAAASWF